jgi:hypothetical protein
MFKADFKLSEQKTIKADFEIKSTGTGGTSDHNKLSNRDLANQHPISAITGLQNSLTSLNNEIDSETERRENEDTVLKAQIDANADAILKTREDLQSDIDNNMAEISSLQADTTTIKNDLDDLGDEVSTIESKIPQNATSSNQLVPKSYVDNLEQDIRSDFASADTSLQTQINGQATAITNVQNKITAIESKIPASASSTNQLADKNFVNSSIATNTAYFIGTFDSIEDLNNYSGTLTNNDYAFVIGQDENGNTVYNRYKYNGSTWIFEYALNNSSFTAQQWASINSGITAEDVEKINNIPTKTSQLENDSLYTTETYVNAREQEIRDDYMQADTDLQQQINGQATEITQAQDDLVDIKGVIPTIATSSNKLITQTQLTNATQSVRSDFASADTELQTQINGLASTLTETNSTLNTIEMAVPSVASASNKLVAKSELPTLVDLAQAGTGIEFERKIQEASNNYTITGSPNIDENGIFTASSTVNYISSPTFGKFNDTMFEFEFTIPSTMETSSPIASFVTTGNPVTIGITTSFKLYFSTPIALQLQTTLSTDTSYIVKFISTGGVNTLSLYSPDGTLLEEKTNTNSITGLSTFSIQIGRTNIPFKFNLNKLSFGSWRAITLAFDGYEISSKVYVPTLTDLAQAGTGIEFERKVRESSNNYTINGTPDIDANGIFTCNSTSNYITSPDFDSLNDTMLEFEFTTPSSVSDVGSMIQCVQEGNTLVLSISLTTAYRVGFSGAISGSLQTVLSPNTSYLLRYKRVGNDNTITILSSSGTQLEAITRTDTITTITSPSFRIGRTTVAIKFDLNKMSFGSWSAITPAFDGYEINSKIEIPDISSNKVNGAPLSNTSSYFFGVCETPASTAEKVVSIPSITELNAGQMIIVRPTYDASSGPSTTIKLNNFPAYQLKYGNAITNTSSDGYMFTAGKPSIFVFDGEYWVFAGQGHRNTYGAMSVSAGITGTNGTAQVVSPLNLKQIIQGTTLTGVDVATSGTVSATDSITTAIGKLQAQITTTVGNIETALNTINSGV